MNKKLVIALVLALVVSLAASPMVMADETDKNTEQKEEEVKQEEETDEEEIHTLDELVVIASKHPEKLSESSVSVEKIDEDDIAKKNAQNVADLLRDVSGLNISDYGGAAGMKTVSIRGSDTNKVLILVDGQQMNSPKNGTADLSQIPIDQIEEIEVLKGPASSLYGANALGGVINIQTKSGSEEPITNVDLNFGSFRTRELKVSHRGSTKELKYNLSALKKITDGHRVHSALDQDRIFTKFGYELDNYSDLILSLNYNEFDKETPGDIYGNASPTESKDERTSINLQWNNKTEDNDMKLMVHHDDHEFISFTRSSETTNKKTGIEFVKTDYYQDHTLTYGLEGERNKAEDDSLKDNEQDNLNKALFIQDEWQASKDLKFNFGGRYDDHEEYDSEFSPRIGTVYNIDSNINLHASAGEAYRAPDFGELYYDYGWFQGNPDLKPETAVGYETGIRYLDSTLKAEFNLFKRDVEDKIELVSGTYKNIDSTEIKGAELIINKNLTDDLVTDFNYTYVDARDEKTDERLPSKAYHTANIGLDYNMKKAQVHLDGKLVGSKKGGPYDVRDELPSYFVADLKLNRELTDDAKISLEINNLLDRDYQVLDGYPMPGRNVMLNLSREF